MVSKPLGYDASQVLPPLADAQTQDGSLSGVDDATRNRETSSVRSGPAAHQTREPSHEQITDQYPTTAATQPGPFPDPSPPPPIKAEPSATPREGTPAQHGGRNNSVTGNPLDVQTLKTVAELKNEHGLRGQARKASTPILESMEAAPTPMPADNKKRPAPKSTAATKKGTAKKPPAKRRKVESDGTPNSSARRSATPSSRTSKPMATGAARSKKGQSGTPALGSSPAPHESGPTSDPELDESASEPEEGAEVYCVCRRPDNHKWMIACDGGCEDWFHGTCVRIREEDGDLIDKFVCPNCKDNGKGNTTWKPMCRRQGCRRPARLTKGNASKYCSDECGELFFTALLERARKQPQQPGHAPPPEAERRKPRRRADHPDHAGGGATTDDEASDADPGPRGGALRPPELKALLASAKDIDAFRRLGDGVLSPPPTASPDDDAGDRDAQEAPAHGLGAAEAARARAIAADKDALRARRALLKDRERFVALTRDQAGRHAEREGVKKDFCGFDPRLAWCEERFRRWRDSRAGRAALRLGTLEAGEGEGEGEGEGMDVDADGAAAAAAAAAAGGDEGLQGGSTVLDGQAEAEAAEPRLCLRKRCERHKHWQKLALQDVRFEEADVADRMRTLDAEEREMRERAALRRRADAAAAARKGAGGVVRGEGWVEVVGE